MLGCCGAPAHWAGRKELFAEQVERWRSQWESLGKPKVILACSTCYQLFKENMPEAEIVSLWQVMAESDLPAEKVLPSDLTARRPRPLHDAP